MSGESKGERGGITDEMITKVFSESRFLKLEHLSLRAFRANERNMALIALCTTNLKSPSFYPFKLDLEVSAFRFIAASNKDLKVISIDIDSFGEFHRSPESSLESLSQLVKIFRECRELQLGATFSDEGKIQEEDLMRICKFLPCRDVKVSVEIGDIYYHYPN